MLEGKVAAIPAGLFSGFFTLSRGRLFRRYK
jgi:hypothetical protein